MDLTEILIRIDDMRTSPIEKEIAFVTDEPKIPGYLCLPNEESEKLFNTNEVFGQGFDLDKIKARVKSAGEFFERLCLYNPQEDKFIISGYKSNKSLVDPLIFHCYSAEQLPSRCTALENITKGVYRWWSVKEMLHNENFLVPAQLIFLSNHFEEEYPIRKESISTGAAFGCSEEGFAFKNGLLEVIERDACISAYLTKREIKEIVSLPCDLKELVDYLKRYRLEPRVFDVTTDLMVPSVLVVTLDRSGIGQAINVGSRADFNYYDAIKRALLESIQCRRVDRIVNDSKAQDYVPDDQVLSLDSRFNYWRSLNKLQYLDFWLKNAETVDYSHLTKQNISLEDSLRIIKKLGYRILVADITLPEIRERGFEVLKVLVPELHPLYLDERAKALYSPHHGIIKDDKSLKPHPLT